MTISVYIPASYKHKFAVQMLQYLLRGVCGVEILDWTEKSSPPPGLTAAERRAWFDADQGGELFHFCASASMEADLLIYYGASGQDAGVEVGMGYASGSPVLGMRGPLEDPGLMLHGAVTAWAEDALDAARIVEGFAYALMYPAERQNGLSADQWAAVKKLYARSMEGRS